MASPTPFHIAICGGGVAGLCMAIGLIRRNISCTLYESALTFAEIGAGVSFGPNALRAMELIDPQIIAGYKNRSTINGWPEKKNTWFDFRIGQEQWRDGKMQAAVGIHVADVRAGNVGQSSIHRAQFLEELARLVPDDVPKFGKKLEEISKRGDKMVLVFSDGTTAEADAVIGCDGVKSRTRKILLGDNHDAANAVFSGRYAYRGLIPMERAVNALGDELARNSQVYMGHHGHVLTFPIEKGKTMNVVAFRTKMDGKWDDERWVLPMKRETMVEDYSGWGDEVQSIISLMEKPDVWALFDHPPAPTYFKGHLCLVGDAAHASTPHQGAGAGQAIEDAYILSSLLSQITSSKDIEQAFKAYDDVRRPRTQKVVVTSRETSCIYEMENEEIGLDLNKARQNLETRFNWIWDDDLTEQLRKAQNAMGI